MRTLDRRVHLLLDDRRHAKVAIEAKRRHVSIAEVIRDAIDRLPTDADVRRAAIERVLAAEPMPVPQDPRDLRRALDHEHERHERRG